MRNFLKWLISLFRKAPALPVTSLEPLVLPHPEELEDKTATIDSVDIEAVRMLWLVRWSVPLEFWEKWKAVGIDITNDISYPAQTLSPKRLIQIKPTWLTPGYSPTR